MLCHKAKFLLKKLSRCGKKLINQNWSNIRWKFILIKKLIVLSKILSLRVLILVWVKLSSRNKNCSKVHKLVWWMPWLTAQLPRKKNQRISQIWCNSPIKLEQLENNMEINQEWKISKSTTPRQIWSRSLSYRVLLNLKEHLVWEIINLRILRITNKSNAKLLKLRQRISVYRRNSGEWRILKVSWIWKKKLLAKTEETQMVMMLPNQQVVTRCTL